jgi:dual specificity phosphatase 12
MMSTFHFVLDRLAIGDIYSRNVEGWTAVVSAVMPEELENMSAPPLPDKVALLHVPIEDCEPGLKPHLDRAVAFIREHVMNGAVLVHCGAGRSRSASIVIAYLVSCGMSIPEAEALVKHRRKAACPFSGFIREIREHYDAERLFHAGPSRF